MVLFITKINIYIQQELTFHTGISACFNYLLDSHAVIYIVLYPRGIGNALALLKFFIIKICIFATSN